METNQPNSTNTENISESIEQTEVAFQEDVDCNILSNIVGRDVPDAPLSDVPGAPQTPAWKKKLSKILDVSLWAVIAVLTTLLLLKIFVVTRVEILQSSMEETYHNHDVVWVNKLAKAERGDVIVFYSEEMPADLWEKIAEKNEHKKYIKRVVAVEGDKIWWEPCSGDTVRLVIETADGQRITEDYYTKGNQPVSITMTADWLGLLQTATEESPFVVPQNCFFACGDNRRVSKDSRELGCFTFDRVFGVVIDYSVGD